MCKFVIKLNDAKEMKRIYLFEHLIICYGIAEGKLE
jgi:hypothetical protein